MCCVDSGEQLRWKTTCRPTRTTTSWPSTRASARAPGRAPSRASSFTGMYRRNVSRECARAPGRAPSRTSSFTGMCHGNVQGRRDALQAELHPVRRLRRHRRPTNLRRQTQGAFTCYSVPRRGGGALRLACLSVAYVSPYAYLQNHVSELCHILHACYCGHNFAVI